MFPYAPQINKKAEELKELGNAAFKDHQYRQAVTHYSSALSYDPQNHVLYSNRSAAYLKLSKFDNAHKDADKCIQLKPDWAKGYYRKAQVLLLTDMPQAAYKYLVVALSYCGNEAERKSITQDLKQSIHNSYSSLPSELPIGVKYFDMQKGRGLYAKRKITKGEIVFHEEALVAGPLKHSFILYCERCFNEIHSSNGVSCDICQTVYCSEQCKQMALNQYHKVLCLRPLEKFNKHPLSQMFELAKCQKDPASHIYLLTLIIKLIAIQVQLLAKTITVPTSLDLNAAKTAFLTAFEEKNGKHINYFPECDKFYAFTCINMKTILEEQSDILEFYSTKLKEMIVIQAMYFEESQQFSDAFTLLQSAKKLFYLFQQESLKQMSIQIALNGLQCLPNVGGLYFIHSLVNHSDEPNCVISHQLEHQQNFCIYVIATRDIQLGEEISLDYFYNCNDDKLRQQNKKKYFI